MTTLAVSADPIPLTADAQGTLRLTGSRVTLDSVIAAFQAGSSPEEIVEQYPTLALADVYSVLGYYLHHRMEVDLYLEQERAAAAAVRREVEARWNPSGVRERLLARRAQQGQ